MCRRTFTGVMKLLKEDGAEVTVEAMHYALAKKADKASSSFLGMHEAFFSRFWGRASNDSGHANEPANGRANGRVEIRGTVSPPLNLQQARSIPVVATQNSGGNLENSGARHSLSGSPMGR